MKRFMAILLAGMLSLSAAVPSFAAVATNAGKWAKPSIEFAYQHLHRHFAEGMIAAILIARKNPNAIQLVDIFIGGSKQLRGIVEGIFLCLLR